MILTFDKDIKHTKTGVSIYNVQCCVSLASPPSKEKGKKPDTIDHAKRNLHWKVTLHNVGDVYNIRSTYF